MKLIHFTDGNGKEIYLNPRYVVSITKTHSEYNNDWCIVFTVHEPNSSFSEQKKIHTILYNTQEECDSALKEFINIIELS